MANKVCGLMNMKRLTNIKIPQCSAILLATLMMVGCEVEFSPNADWKDVPVVYCVLDQDDDTTWVRVERCYLSEGDIYQFGTNSDSINYPAGSLQVSLIALRNGTPVDSIAFDTTTANHNDGLFVSSRQPLYCANTRRRLMEDCAYELRIRRTVDGSMLAKARTNLITKRNEGHVVTSPNDNKVFGFSVTKYCSIEWKGLDRARMYQPIVRFFYQVDNDTMYLDLPCSQVVSVPRIDSSTAPNYSVQYGKDAFLTSVYEAFKDDNTPKGYLKIFDIYITACNEDLYAYMTSVAAGSNLEQSHEIYTNIEGGLGVFASRRTHISRRVPGDPSDREGVGLYALLKEMDVGFY